MYKPSLFDWLTGALVVLVVVGALETIEWIVLITDAPIPYLGRFMPYLGPCAVLILMFNLALTDRMARWRPALPLDVILFAVFVVALFAIELGHGIARGEDLNIWLQMSFFWMFVCYAALRSFDGYLPRSREKIVAATVGVILITALADVLLVNVLAEAWESAPLGLNPLQLFNSAYVGYVSVFGLALVLFDLPSRGYRMAIVRYGVLAPLFIWSAYLQRLTGPTLLIALVLGIRGITLLRRRSQQALVVAASVVVLAAWAAFVLPGDGNPTVEGLRQGPFFLEERGLIHGDIWSSYIRRETIVQELRLFLTSPVVGVGMNKASEIRVLLFGMHSSLLYVLVTTGLCGFGLMAVWLGWTVWQGWRARGMAALALPAIVGAMMLLQTEPVWWWAIAGYVVAAPSAGPPVEQG